MLMCEISGFYPPGLGGARVRDTALQVLLPPHQGRPSSSAGPGGAVHLQASSSLKVTLHCFHFDKFKLK